MTTNLQAIDFQDDYFDVYTYGLGQCTVHFDKDLREYCLVSQKGNVTFSYYFYFDNYEWSYNTTLIKTEGSKVLKEELQHTSAFGLEYDQETLGKLLRSMLVASTYVPAP